MSRHVIVLTLEVMAPSRRVALGKVQALLEWRGKSMDVIEHAEGVKVIGDGAGFLTGGPQTAYYPRRWPHGRLYGRQGGREEEKHGR